VAVLVQHGHQIVARQYPVQRGQRHATGRIQIGHAAVFADGEGDLPGGLDDAEHVAVDHLGLGPGVRGQFTDAVVLDA